MSATNAHSAGKSYYPVSHIGSGGFGVVELVIRKPGNWCFAQKTLYIHPGGATAQEVEQEFNILSRLSHPNIVRYVDFSLFRGEAKIYMEACLGGTLKQYIEFHKGDLPNSPTNMIPEVVIWNIISQLSAALAYCHEGKYVDWDDAPDQPSPWSPVIHRDIKPGNIFLSDYCSLPSVKLGDFGLSAVLTRTHAPSTYVGTPQYMPPEINHLGGNIIWTTSCDIYSLGCSLYEMCTLKAAFDYRMEGEHDTFEAIPPVYSDMLRQRIAACMSFDPRNRPSARDLYKSANLSLSDHGMCKAAIELLYKDVQTSFDNNIDQAFLKACYYGNEFAARLLLRLGANIEARGLQTVDLDISRFTVHGYMPESAHQRSNSASPEGANAAMSLPLTMDVEPEDHSWMWFYSVLHELLPRSVTQEQRGYLLNIIFVTRSANVTALSLAAMRGHEGVLRLLLRKGVDVEVKCGIELKTALHLAAAEGHEESLRCLLDNGANIATPDRGGRTPLHLAASRGNLACIATLLDRGADTGAVMKPEVALEFAPVAAAVYGGLLAVRLLLEKEPPISPNPRLLPALCAALCRHENDIARILVDEGADPNGEYKGVTPLQCAAFVKFDPIMRFLISRGADVNARGFKMQEYGPLGLAILQGHESTVQMLVQLGADVKNVESAAFGNAAYQGRTRILRILLDRARMPKSVLDEALLCSVMNQKEDTVQLLLERGADASQQIHSEYSEVKMSLLGYADSKGNKNIVRLLRQHGADITEQERLFFPPSWTDPAEFADAYPRNGRPPWDTLAARRRSDRPGSRQGFWARLFG